MPWYAKYDGVDGSSHSDRGAHLLYDIVVPAGQNADVIVQSYTHSNSSGADLSLFQPQLTSVPTGPEPILDTSAVATLHSFEFFL